MTCEICDEQTATMWVEEPINVAREGLVFSLAKKILSCDDCGPQLGYKVLAPLNPVGFVPAWNTWLVPPRAQKDP